MDQFWINKPSILLKHRNLKNFWPLEKMSQNEKLNAITRLVLYLTMVAMIFLEDKIKFLGIGLVTILIIIGLYYVNKDKDIKEKNMIEGFTTEINKNNWTMPSPQNPAMNVMVTDIQDNPKRRSAAPVTKEINEKIDDNAKKFVLANYDTQEKEGNNEMENKLYRDLGDTIDFKNSMRAWYPTANTQIPSNHDAYKKFIVGDMGYCKKEYNYCSDS